jgi:DNA-binding NarL/FixJ family response regulator
MRMCEGMTVEQIAEVGYVSETTVRTQVRSILSKLNVNRQVEAVVLAYRTGWMPVDEGEAVA